MVGFAGIRFCGVLGVGGCFVGGIWLSFRIWWWLGGVFRALWLVALALRVWALVWCFGWVSAWLFDGGGSRLRVWVLDVLDFGFLGFCGLDG